MKKTTKSDINTLRRTIRLLEMAAEKRRKEYQELPPQRIGLEEDPELHTRRMFRAGIVDGVQYAIDTLTAMLSDELDVESY